MITPFGFFEFIRMPVGVGNAVQTFQHFIHEVLHGFEFVYAYIDDLLIASSSPTEHLDHLNLLFTRLQEYGIIINPAKCWFGQESLEFLGHLIAPDGISPFPKKVRAILDFPQPTSLKNSVNSLTS